MKQQRIKSYNGFVSDGAKKRMTKAITLLTQIAEPVNIYNPVTKRMQLHRLSFITLTVSDPEKKMTGKEAHQKLLSHFLQWMRRTKKINTYIWKAELQKNGQIHYHITTPAFINYQEIRDKWNNLQKQNGLLDRYHAMKGHYDANSTDVHEVKAIKNLAAYMVKYLVKSYQNSVAIGGKVWDCSENLKANNYYSVEMSQQHLEFINLAVENELATQYNGKMFSIIKFKEAVEEYLLTDKELFDFEEFKKRIRAWKDAKESTTVTVQPLASSCQSQLLPPLLPSHKPSPASVAAPEIFFPAARQDTAHTDHAHIANAVPSGWQVWRASDACSPCQLVLPAVRQHRPPTGLVALVLPAVGAGNLPSGVQGSGGMTLRSMPCHAIPSPGLPLTASPPASQPTVTV